MQGDTVILIPVIITYLSFFVSKINKFHVNNTKDKVDGAQFEAKSQVSY